MALGGAPHSGGQLCRSEPNIGGCGAASSLRQRAAEPEPLSGHPGGRGQPAQVPGQHARRAVHRALAAAPLPHDRARRAAAAPAQPAQGLPQAGRVVRGQGLPLACARCGSNPNAPAPAAPHTPAAHRRTAAPPLVPPGTSATPCPRRPAHAALPTAAQRCRARTAASAWRARRRSSRLTLTLTLSLTLSLSLTLTLSLTLSLTLALTLTLTQP